MERAGQDGQTPGSEKNDCHLTPWFSKNVNQSIHPPIGVYMYVLYSPAPAPIRLPLTGAFTRKRTLLLVAPFPS